MYIEWIDDDGQYHATELHAVRYVQPEKFCIYHSHWGERVVHDYKHMRLTVDIGAHPIAKQQHEWGQQPPA